MKNIAFILALLLFLSCNRKKDNNKVVETRISGTAELLVDESFARILDDQVEVF